MVEGVQQGPVLVGTFISVCVCVCLIVWLVGCVIPWLVLVVGRHGRVQKAEEEKQ